MIQGLEVFSSAYAFQEEDLRGATAVMIDVMRASSTIITALHHGAKGVIPVEYMDEASMISRNHDASDFLFCGEKDGKKIEGYDLGNSPQEYTSDVVNGKSIIFNTTNGTKALKRSSLAREIFIGGFLNMSIIVNKLRQIDGEIALVCAGWKGRMSLEDLLCAGNIIYEITEGRLPDYATDGAKVAFGLYEKFGNDIVMAVMNSNHARRLKEITGSGDIQFCCTLNTMEILPRLEDGIITDIHGN